MAAEKFDKYGILRFKAVNYFDNQNKKPKYPLPNAFVAGGQQIFVNSGLILQSNNAGQIIGVLAHEIGHISGGHLIKGTKARYIKENNCSFISYNSNIASTPSDK